MWGIVSSLPEHRLCWTINKAFDWRFKRADDVEMYIPTLGASILFPYFKYDIEEDHYSLELIRNKSTGAFLLPELKNVDFLFLVKGETDFFMECDFSRYLMKVPGVQHVLELDPEKLKSRHNLILE